jgi:hypothetical protein
MENDPFPDDLDGTRPVDQLPKRPGRARMNEPFEQFGQPPVDEVREHRQSQINVHVQSNVATQTIEVKKRDLFTQVILEVIPACVSLNDFACRLWFRLLVGQEEGRRFVSQSRHDQLP